MQPDKNLFYKKSIVPWYDSNFTCRLSMALSTIVLFFSIIGVKTALKIDAYRGFVKLPWLLVGLCLFLIISTGTRLIRRHRPS